MVHLIGITEMRDDESEFSSQQSTSEEQDRDSQEEQRDVEVIEEKDQEEYEQEQIEFPQLRKLKEAMVELLPIPKNYQFDDLMQYRQTMLRLEDENFFQSFRKSLQHHIQQKFQDEKTKKEGFYVISNFSIERPTYEPQGGLILEIETLVIIPRYMQEQAEIINNQIVIFVSLNTQKIFIGKTIVKWNKKVTKDYDGDLRFEGYDNKDERKKDQKNDDDLNKNLFEVIEYRQNFKIKMNTLDNLDEFLINSDDINSKFKLVIPSDYWNSLQQSWNCQMQFKHLNNIAFPLQTLQGEKGFPSFPKYEFLENDIEVEDFKRQLEFEISKEKQLDKYQRIAIRHALFNENSIIQGPPGTGKTFLGCKIVNVLQRAHSIHIQKPKPILVMSLKNLSLDRLLLKISDENKDIKILRLGFEIEYRQMEKYTLNNLKGAPVFQYSDQYNIKADQINKELQDCINNIKKRRDQNIIQQEKGAGLPKKLKNSIKKRLISLLISELKITNFGNEIQEKIFSKWMKGKLSSEKLLKYLDEGGIDLDGEQKEYIQKSINIQQKDQEFQLSADENSIMRYLEKITLFEQLSVQFSKFLKINEDIIEINIIQNQMRVYERLIKTSNLNSNKIYQKKLSKFMKKFDVIGMTFSGYHKNFDAIQELGAEIVLVEEASEIIESHFYPVLAPNVKHLIQIGDHYQLRPFVKCDSLKSNYNYKMSYFERLISVNKVDHVILYQQRRMVPQFANFTRIFYGNEYIDAPITKSRECITQISKNGMYMLQHSYPDQQEDKSFINLHEALFVKLLVLQLLKDQKIEEEQISVLTTYKIQKILIQCFLSEQGLSKVKTYTVDQFQGNENDIIILSCVRSNIERKSGFVLNDHRINVAFSRAKIGFFCIGNFNQYALKSETWQKILDLSQKQFSLGAKGVEAQYKTLSKKALEIGKNAPKDLYKSPQICGLCFQKSHIMDCALQFFIPSISPSDNEFPELPQVEQAQPPFVFIETVQKIKVDKNKLILDQLAEQFPINSNKLTQKQKKQFQKSKSNFKKQ
ncbi:AAA domain protein (macronuclear) [Tetrahymena thermophila SB210]|uniref:AAA domain protein n=1 Tax=Tetrahymena thermophila (strain SB210) TaxID=312017 RepID=I7LXH8_TETTS|nr:AAA domain protein [Tetrahymena thermophila SB210]EAS04671.2 AAA domain protein [Tetrahymena thermophila SB210]|eukprot:XP_001024916.2 AAA domain protein [Tetrahymena thermophila SB210]